MKRLTNRLANGAVYENIVESKENAISHLASIEDILKEGEKMNANKLKEILENHKLWLDNNGGCQADLSQADLSWANLSGADLSQADLSWANLSGANLRGANLSWANLSGADLRGANLRGANLSWANLSGAKGLLSPSDVMAKNFERTEDGYIAYKTFNGTYAPPPSWKIEPGSVISETVNFDRCTDCGCGVNVAPLEWVKREYPNTKIWKVLIRWEWLPGVCVPYMTDGKIRCEKVELLEVCDDGIH